MTESSWMGVSTTFDQILDLVAFLTPIAATGYFAGGMLYFLCWALGGPPKRGSQFIANTVLWPLAFLGHLFQFVVYTVYSFKREILPMFSYRCHLDRK